MRADEALGIFAGAGTSTATLQAIIAAMKSDGAAVGYSVAYPFGVAVPILCSYSTPGSSPRSNNPPDKLLKMPKSF